MAFLAAVSLLIPLATGCSTKEDMEAKARIFSPEEPGEVELQASKPLDVGALDKDAAMGRHVLTMGAEEAFRRLGAHKMKASASFEWRMDDKKVALSENRIVVMEALDRFQLLNENDMDRGHELILLGKDSYVKPKYLQWRRRVRERKAALADLESNYGLLRSAVAMMRDRLTLVADGREALDGRDAVRYSLALAKDPVASPGTAGLPPPVYPEGGPSPDTQLRLDFAMLGIPQAVGGQVWVDAATGVPLKSEIWGSVSVMTKGTDALVQLKMSHQVYDVGAVAPLAPPEAFLPAEDRPNAIAAALNRFGVAAPKDEGASKAAPGAQDGGEGSPSDE